MDIRSEGQKTGIGDKKPVVMGQNSSTTISVPVTRTYHEDDWEILAEVYHGPWSQKRDWTCYLCHRLITKVFGDDSNIIDHFWAEHRIAPVYRGYTWIGRPRNWVGQPRIRREKMQYSINEAMVLSKALRGRLGELSSLRAQCATLTHYYGDAEKTETPQYDVKKVDAKCVAIENFLLLVETAIKQSNAVTKITVDVNAQDLLTPIS